MCLAGDDTLLNRRGLKIVWYGDAPRSPAVESRIYSRSLGTLLGCAVRSD